MQVPLTESHWSGAVGCAEFKTRTAHQCSRRFPRQRVRNPIHDGPSAARRAADDHGGRQRRVVHALPGSGTSLRLSGQYVWTEPTLDGDSVELARVDYFQDPGFSEWAVLAVQPGTATIAACGNPQCADQEPCPDGPLRFEIEITVEP